MKSEDDYRERAEDHLYESDFISGIKMKAWPEAGGYGNLDDCWDADGDSVVSCAEPLFRMEGEALIQASFAQGTDPRFAARILRKFADMLDGPNGYAIANMGLRKGDFDLARRLEDGDVQLDDLSAIFAEAFGEEDRQED